MPSFNYNLGNNLKKIRVQKNYTQAFVAEHADIDITHYSRIERNCCDTKVQTLYNICSALGINITDLFK